MVSVPDPAVLLTLAWLVALFATGFRYQWGSLPPARALVVVSAGLLWLAYSLLRLSSLVAPPYDDALGATSVLLLLAGLWLFSRWWRRRRGADAASE
jgi:hypothetical protein